MKKKKKKKWEEGNGRGRCQVFVLMNQRHYSALQIEIRSETCDNVCNNLKSKKKREEKWKAPPERWLTVNVRLSNQHVMIDERELRVCRVAAL